jgi:type IV pilus assembly protein PilW
MSKGFSIVEFMIAIAIGTLLVATVGSIYISNKKTFSIQESLARLQENARVANYILNKDIRMAGFQGCAGESFLTMKNIIRDPSRVLLYDTPISGSDSLASSFSPALPSNIAGKVAIGSDVIELRMATHTGVQLRDDMNRANNPILVYERLGIRAGEVLMVSNCSVGDIFIAGGNTNASSITHTATNNLSNSLSTAYTAGSQISRYIYYSFFVKNTGRTNTENQPIYALVRQDMDGNEVEIIDGIEKMKISYGVDTNEDKTADRYQTATEIEAANNWNKIISVKVNLLFATVENIATEIQLYEFNGAQYTPTDRKLRREWETFITIRNRGLPS